MPVTQTDKKSWTGYTEKCIGCDIEGCEVWTMCKVKNTVNVTPMKFACGFCAYKRINSLEKTIEDMETKLKSAAKETATLGTNAQLLTGNVKSFAEVVGKLKDDGLEQKLNKLEEIEKKLGSFDQQVKKAVKAQHSEGDRKKKMIIFNLAEKVETTDRAQVNEIVTHLHPEQDATVVSSVIRMEKKNEEDTSVRPVIVEFKSEYEKWNVLKNKTALKNTTSFRRVFLELDRTKEERLVAKQRYQMKKQERPRPKQDGELVPK